MKLKELILNLPVGGSFDPEVEISGIAYDSRRVIPGNIFVAIRGENFDGFSFIPEAKRKGAIAFVSSTPIEVENLILVEDTREFLAIISRRFYGEPDKEMKVIGVTGTNGKSTITHLVASIFNAAGIKSAVIGTLGCVYGDTCEPLANTTPESKDLFELMRKLADKGVRALAMEASSHGLFLKRVYGIAWAGAVFTNLTQDHLDFHKDMESYFLAKRILFESLGKLTPSIVNIDDPYGKRLRDEFGSYTASLNDPSADYFIETTNFSLTGSQFTLRTPRGTVRVSTPLLGRFNAYNAVLAGGIANLLGISLENIAKGLEDAKGIRGRIERVEGNQPFHIFIDYAHTPDALQTIITTIRELHPKRLILVFGCGGDRDKTKRPIMGRIAAQLADYVIVTSDNPRSEDPESIIDQIVTGINSGQKYIRISDRKTAIFTALEEARPDDAVVIAGKGHETYQIIGNMRIHFDDKEVVEEWLRKRGYLG